MSSSPCVVVPSQQPGLLLGRYELRERIGEGGMGVVWRSYDLDLEEMVAVKFLRDDFANDELLRGWFRREVKLARRVTHPNVARVFELGRDGTRYFLTMEFVAGESLQAVLDREGRIAPGQLTQLAIGLCRGLAAAHSAGVVHGDIKPGNIMLSPGRGAVLTDFGIAQAMSEGHVREDSYGGTPMYMAPEQLFGARLTTQADVYAVGVLLFEALTGRLPWLMTSLQTLLETKGGGQAPNLAPLAAPGLRPWAQLITDCLRTTPAERPADAEVLLARIVADSARLSSVEAVAALAASSSGEPTGSSGAAPLAGANQIRRAGSTWATGELIDGLRRPRAPRMRHVGDDPKPAPGEVTGHPPMNAPSAALYDQAHRALLAMHVAPAVQLYREALQHDPSHPLLQLGHTLAQLKAAQLAGAPSTWEELAQMRQTAVQAVLDHPGLGEAYMLMADVLNIAGEPIAAAQAAVEALRRSPGLAPALTLIGEMLTEIGRLPDAERRLDAALAPGQASVQLWGARANLRAYQGRWDEFYELADGPLRELHFRSVQVARLMLWRPDRPALVRLEQALAHNEDQLPPSLLQGTRDVVSFALVPGQRRAIFDRLAATGLSAVNPGRCRFYAQMLCEMACTLGDHARAHELLAMADTHALFDLHWLEHCPLIEPLRHDSSFAGSHASVRARADELAATLLTGEVRPWPP